MARHTIPIADGKGSIRLIDGSYKVTAVAGGYDSTTISPKDVTITTGTDSYAFTISATGTLTLHVTDTGQTSGVAVVGAKFIRTDSTGTVVGSEETSNQDGNVVFSNVPYATTGSSPIYYKQIASDGGHLFDNTVKMVTMTTSTQTIEIANENAPLRNFTLTDTSFPNIVIKDGQIILEDS